MSPQKVQIPSKTQKLFHKINDYAYLTGLLNLRGEEFHMPVMSTKPCFKFLYRLIDVLIHLMILLEFGAVYKRDTFDSKQTSDWIIFCFSHPLLYMFYLNILYYKSKVQDLLTYLTVQLKMVYNDKGIEEIMIRKAKIYMVAYFLLCCLTLTMYGFDSVVQVVRLDKTFTTVIVAWPDVEDRSNLAAIARITYYIIWWMFIFRTSNAYVLAIATTICLSHQFKNLQSYFYGLEGIFKEEDLNQIEKENKYEKALKVGISLHADTLWCTRQCQIVYGLGYNVQILISLAGLVLLMLQMVNAERTIFNALAIIVIASTILVTTGIFMWNAGDVTIEACKLATAMYNSGWQHCRGPAAVRVRSLLGVAMTQAQQSVIMRGFGIMHLSYESFLSIVKSSYSVFSVVY